VLEPGRSLWKLNGATFSAKQSSVAMIQQKDGEKPIDHPRRSINRRKKPHRTESTRRHGGCTRGAIKSAACATFGMDERERQKAFYPDLHGDYRTRAAVVVNRRVDRSTLRSDGIGFGAICIGDQTARFQNATRNELRVRRAKPSGKCIFRSPCCLFFFHLFIYLYVSVR